tara:strand:+ start:3151 stop:3852 length:702 start_codon:yes stop_codon:yes gene_type:complete
MYIGIDGYINGWCCCVINNDIDIQLHDSLNNFVNQNQTIKRVFIDMPVGLSSLKFSRKIDREVRKLLPKKNKGSVFTPPCREALIKNTYKEGNSINKDITGKGISIQSWNLNKKIIELDKLLINNLNLRSIIHESHPELCFLKFNHSKPLESNKKTREGIKQRVKLIQNEIKNIGEILNNTVDKFRGTKLKIDDILDAIILAISAKKWEKNGSRILTQLNTSDEKNIPVAVYY